MKNSMTFHECVLLQTRIDSQGYETRYFIACAIFTILTFIITIKEAQTILGCLSVASLVIGIVILWKKTNQHEQLMDDFQKGESFEKVAQNLGYLPKQPQKSEGGMASDS